MGIFEGGKKAMGAIGNAGKIIQAQNKIKKIEAVGQSASLSFLINGMYEFPETYIDKEKLKEELGADFTDKQIDKIIAVFLKNIKNGIKDARAQLEKKMRDNTDNLDLLKDLMN